MSKKIAVRKSTPLTTAPLCDGGQSLAQAIHQALRDSTEHFLEQVVDELAEHRDMSAAELVRAIQVTEVRLAACKTLAMQAMVIE